MDTEYLDYDPLERMKPYDNSLDTIEAKKLEKKKDHLDQVYRPPSKPVKCPKNLTTLDL